MDTTEIQKIIKFLQKIKSHPLPIKSIKTPKIPTAKIKHKAVHTLVLEKERNSKKKNKRTNPKKMMFSLLAIRLFSKEKQDTQKQS